MKLIMILTFLFLPLFKLSGTICKRKLDTFLIGKRSYILSRVNIRKYKKIILNIRRDSLSKKNLEEKNNMM